MDRRSAAILGEIAAGALTPGARLSALTTLQSLAQDTDLEAIRALCGVLARELGYEGVALELADEAALSELAMAAGVPPLLRIHALGYFPRRLLAEAAALAPLAREVSTQDEFIRFQRLVRQGSPLQHEALKSYVLAAFLSMAGTVMLEHLSPGNQQSMLDTILDQCRVVPGESAEMGMSFGRDLLLRLVSPRGLITIIVHELGHHVFDWAAASGLSKAPADPVSPADAQGFVDITLLLPKLLRAAARLGSQPIQPGDERNGRTAAGLSLLCSHVVRSRGTYTHLSLTDRGGPIDLARAGQCACFILAVLGVEPLEAAAAYSPRGVFHFGFRGEGPIPKGLERKLRRLDVRPLVDTLPAAGARWLDELGAARRLGRSGEELAAALGVEEAVPAYFGPNPEPAWRDQTLRDQMRRGASLQGAGPEVLSHLLCAAARCADPVVVAALLRAGAAADARTPDGRAAGLFAGQSLCVLAQEDRKTYYGPTPSDIHEVLDALRAAGLDLNLPLDAEGNTLLLDAAGRDAAPVRFLLARGADVERSNQRGETPLYIAVSYAPLEAVELLLAAGARPEAPRGDGNTPLHAAAERGDEAVVQALLRNGDGAGAGAANHAGETPLMLSQSAVVVSLLCGAGADVDSATPSGQTTLMRVAARGQSDLIRRLLELGADVHAATDLGETALHFAVLSHDEESQRECLEALLDAGADVNEETREGVTPLIAAAGLGHVAALTTLLARGADVHARTVNGRTALIRATDPASQWVRDFNRGARAEEVIRRLAQAGVDVNADDEFGYTALHYATQWFDAGLVRVLLEAGADPNVRTQSGATPLAQAVANGHSMMAELLTAAGADAGAAGEPRTAP